MDSPGKQCKLTVSSPVGVPEDTVQAESQSGKVLNEACQTDVPVVRLNYTRQLRLDIGQVSI